MPIFEQVYIELGSEMTGFAASLLRLGNHLNLSLIHIYARINEYGFVEAPYRKIDKSDPKNPRVTDEVVYMLSLIHI